MDELKVCFTGVGSIAGRHIRNLRNICEEEHIDVTVDAYRRKASFVAGVDNVYTEINEIPDDYDVIFITNPTEMHLETLKASRCGEGGCCKQIALSCVHSISAPLDLSFLAAHKPLRLYDAQPGTVWGRP